MPSEARQKKIMEKLNRAQKCSILGPQNLGLGVALEAFCIFNAQICILLHSRGSFPLIFDS